jgi:hypothetical protein
MPERKPPIDAKATRSHVKWRGSLNLMVGFIQLALIGFCASSSSSSAISSSISAPPCFAILIAVEARQLVIVKRGMRQPSGTHHPILKGGAHSQNIVVHFSVGVDQEQAVHCLAILDQGLRLRGQPLYSHQSISQARHFYAQSSNRPCSVDGLDDKDEQTPVKRRRERNSTTLGGATVHHRLCGLWLLCTNCARLKMGMHSLYHLRHHPSGVEGSLVSQNRQFTLLSGGRRSGSCEW